MYNHGMWKTPPLYGASSLPYTTWKTIPRLDHAWRKVTPEMVAKYEAFSKRCMEDYMKKMNEPHKVFVELKKSKNPGL